MPLQPTIALTTAPIIRPEEWFFLAFEFFDPVFAMQEPHSWFLMVFRPIAKHLIEGQILPAVARANDDRGLFEQTARSAMDSTKSTLRVGQRFGGTSR